MKFIVFSIFFMFSQVIFAQVNVGDTAYKITTPKNCNTNKKSHKKSVVIEKVKKGKSHQVYFRENFWKDSGGYSEQIRVIAEGLLKKYRTFKNPVKLKEYCENLEGFKTNMESVEVPAGRFLACKLVRYSPSAIQTTWVGAVPFGTIKAKYASRYPNKPCEIIKELDSYEFVGN